MGRGSMGGRKMAVPAGERADRATFFLSVFRGTPRLPKSSAARLPGTAVFPPPVDPHPVLLP